MSVVFLFFKDTSVCNLIIDKTVKEILSNTTVSHHKGCVVFILAIVRNKTSATVFYRRINYRYEFGACELKHDIDLF